MTSLTRKARVAGSVYIIASLVGFLRLIYIPNNLIVSGSAATTAGNIAAHESLFRWGMVTYLIAGVLFFFVTLALYRLLTGVDRDLAILMVVLGGLIPSTLFVVNTFTDAGALLSLRGTYFASAFNESQRDASAMLFLDLHHYLDLANAIFWGMWLIPLGLLVYRSRFLPRFIGVWLILGCFSYLAFSVTGFLSPGLEDKVFTYGQPFMLGEVALMLWLLIRGAKEPRSVAPSRA